MNTSFWDSNLFQTIVLIVTIGTTVGIALWQFHVHKQTELRNAVSILILQIKDIEKNIEYIFSEGLINKVAQRIREQQIYIKQKIQLSMDNRVFYYYNTIYNQAVIADNPAQCVQLMIDKFNELLVPSYIQKEFASGLEKTLKQYHKLTDGIAYTELLKLK